MSIYKLAIDGCDASTIFTLSISDKNAAFLRAIAEAVNVVAETEQPCAPTMRIEEFGERLNYHFTITPKDKE